MRSRVETWVDEICAEEQSECVATKSDTAAPNEQKENKDTAAKAKKRVFTDVADVKEMDETPRANKRRQETLGNATLSSASSEADSVSEIESHNSGRLSPIKQLEALRDADEPTVFCAFDDPRYPESGDVATLRDELEDIACGIGIIHFAYEGDEMKRFLDEGKHAISRHDRIKFGTPSAWNEQSRLRSGTTPPLAAVAAVVKSAQRLSDQDEDTWNHDVHRCVIDISLNASTHLDKLEVHSVKAAKIDPPTLCQYATLPRRVVDYAIVLKAPELHQAWRRLQPLPGTLVKSWNHTTLSHIREMPIAVNIETKAPSKSWTDGKPQIAIWMGAWRKRLELLYKESSSAPLQISAVPLLIVQGHDWYAFTMERAGNSTIFRERIDVGNTRSLFGTYKIIAALQCLAHWAENVWRPFFANLVTGLFENT